MLAAVVRAVGGELVQLEVCRGEKGRLYMFKSCMEWEKCSLEMMALVTIVIFAARSPFTD